MKNTKFSTKATIIVLIIALLVGMLASSCSVQKESLLVHDSKDCLVLSYEYPYAEVLIMPDSIISYKYITDINCKPGMYLICEDY